MSVYQVIDFMKSNNIYFLGDYSDFAHIEYLKRFTNESFEFDGEVRSLGVKLLIPSNNREAHVYLSNYTSEEIIAFQEKGSKPSPIGTCDFTLWRDGRAEISRIMKW